MTTTDREIVSTRVFAVPREKIFTAWTDPALLARWWGPNGFSNSFEEFDLRPGGHWRFVMHGPDGTDYPNHSVFVEISAPEHIVLDHLSAPRFRVDATFEEVGNAGSETRVTFRMLFETPEVCAAVAAITVPANEENFDRMSAVLAEMN